VELLVNERTFKTLFPTLPKQRLRLTLNYVTPSLNRTIRQHWTEQLREKKRGWTALSSALKATASDPSTPTTFAGGCKGLLDGLRHAHLIKGDESWRIIFQTERERVQTFGEERTEITIDYP
jgi:hypothetical protein